MDDPCWVIGKNCCATNSVYLELVSNKLGSHCFGAAWRVYVPSCLNRQYLRWKCVVRGFSFRRACSIIEFWTPSPIRLAKPRMVRPGLKPVMADGDWVWYVIGSPPSDQNPSFKTNDVSKSIYMQKSRLWKPSSFEGILEKCIWEWARNKSYANVFPLLRYPDGSTYCGENHNLAKCFNGFSQW